MFSDILPLILCEKCANKLNHRCPPGGRNKFPRNLCRRIMPLRRAIVNRNEPRECGSRSALLDDSLEESMQSSHHSLRSFYEVAMARQWKYSRCFERLALPRTPSPSIPRSCRPLTPSKNGTHAA